MGLGAQREVVAVAVAGLVVGCTGTGVVQNIGFGIGVELGGWGRRKLEVVASV